MNIFRENFKKTEFEPKVAHLHNFEHNMNFPGKSKTVTFNQSLMPVIKYNFRKI